MSIIQKLNTPFFLTGDTALSRHYFNHRYSDDLDLFVNSNSEFQFWLDKIFISLSSSEHNDKFILEKETIKKFESFSQIFLIDIKDPSVRLKIDFVNDIAQHYGDFENNHILGKIDSWQNILSNKLTSLFRFEPKDITDIWIISLNKKFSWQTIMKEAKNKEAGVEPEVIFNILKSFPIEQLETIKWVVKPDFSKIKNDLNTIAEDILFGRENSIFNG